MYMSKPSDCLVLDPNPQSVRFAGRYVNISAIARSQGLSQSYVSKLLSGKQSPSILVAKKVAAALGMGLEDLLEAIEQRTNDSPKESQRDLVDFGRLEFYSRAG
jgi:transcriptional regulator with XRE-family HTH domain